MVQKYKSPVRLYKYPFELVMAAYVRRFPTCQLIPVLVATDVLKEETSEDGSVEVIERRCKLNVDAPYLLKKMAGVDYFYCIQRNTLDKKARTLKIEAWNETFAKKIIINEFCTYFVHEENENWTCFEQSASLEVKSFFGLENAVEKLAVKHYAASIGKGKEIIELYIQELKEEGITFVPKFEDEGQEEDGKEDKECQEDDRNDERPEVPPVSVDELHSTSNESSEDHSKEVLQKTSTEASASGSPVAAEVVLLGPSHRTLSLTESRPESLVDERRLSHDHLASSPQMNHSLSNSLLGSGQKDPNSVKNQVMSKAKNKICFIYNVINENIQREAV